MTVQLSSRGARALARFVLGAGLACALLGPAAIAADAPAILADDLIDQFIQDNNRAHEQADRDFETAQERQKRWELQEELDETRRQLQKERQRHIDDDDDDDR